MVVLVLPSHADPALVHVADDAKHHVPIALAIRVSIFQSCAEARDATARHVNDAAVFSPHDEQVTAQEWIWRARD